MENYSVQGKTQGVEVLYGEGFDRAFIYAPLNLSCRLDMVSRNGTEPNRLLAAFGSGPVGIG
jgi:hypothetical protein